MTPAQLKAFTAVVRLGSVKAAAEERGVSEAAVSMHVAHLRRELEDKLFVRTASGLAFTPGGLRLASRAVEILGLQDRTLREVSQAGDGRRLLRLAASSLFAEHAAPGLIELFAGRADDLDVELSVWPAAQLPGLLAARTVDFAVGPALQHVPEFIVHKPFLNYHVVAVVGPRHPLAGQSVTPPQVRDQRWLLGPSAASEQGVIPDLLRRLGVPEYASPSSRATPPPSRRHDAARVSPWRCGSRSQTSSPPDAWHSSRAPRCTRPGAGRLSRCRRTASHPQRRSCGGSSPHRGRPRR